MKLIAQLIVILTIACQFIAAQGIDESHLKCSHAKIAKAMIASYRTPTITQNDYDITFYDIDLKIDPSDSTIIGKVAVQGISLISSLNLVELDLSSSLEVESVKTEQGNDLNYNHNSNLLSVTLDNPIDTGNSFRIIVDYDGRPPTTGFGSFTFRESS